LATRNEVVECLKQNDFPRLLDIARGARGIFRILISLSYDKEDVVNWRAIEAIGLIAGERAKTDPAGVRGLVQKILWMMREESGNNPWSAPDMLGEIVRNSPDEFSDIAPIIVSFHDEEILRRGVLRAVARIGEIRPDLVESASPIVGDYLNHNDALTRFYALLIVRRLRLTSLLPYGEALERDKTELKVYEDRCFKTVSLAKIAEETVIILRARGK
jgi:hypothetical protein